MSNFSFIHFNNNHVLQVKDYLRLTITKSCNLNCYYCHKEGFDKPLETGYQIFPDVIAAIDDLCFKKVKLVGGEPFCSPLIWKYFDCLENIKELGVTTNATYIYKLRKKLLNFKNVSFNLSVNTLFIHEYYRITGKKYLSDVLKGIDFLFENGFKFKINMLVKKQNYQEIPAMLEFCDRINIPLKILDLVDSNSTEYVSIDSVYSYLLENYNITNKRIEKDYLAFNVDTSKVLLPLRYYPSYCNNCHYYPCAEGLSSIRVSEDGIVKTCFQKEIGKAKNKYELQFLLRSSRNQIDASISNIAYN